jgi:glycosyl hydrolase family 32
MAFMRLYGLILLSLSTILFQAHPVMIPRISGDWIEIASDPDLGALTAAQQQPVDFAIWQAADGTWQLWSCIRGTKAPGKTRLFHAWESPELTRPNWKPKGIAMEADEKYSETPGGLQAPHVVNISGLFHMFYGDWENICAATSVDGKQFTRRLNAKDRPGMFTEGQGSNTRDPMVVNINGKWHCYYTAFPFGQGSVYCRTSSDTREWSPPRIVAFGGEAGTNPFSAECPFVVELTRGEFYLFRTQKYGTNAITRVYHSHDAMHFGINEDPKYLVGNLPVAAPELILYKNQWYIAALAASLKGIRLAKLEWVKK